MKPFVSIATYNESHNIERLIRGIFELSVQNLNIVIIDDNSPDGTAKIVENLQNEFPLLHLITRNGKSGYGGAHVRGFKYALEHDAEIIISMDADFSHDPAMIPELVRELQNGCDMVVGSRRVENGKVVGWNFWRKFCSKGAMMLSKALLGIKTKDLTSGFRAYHNEVLSRINLDGVLSDGYSFLEEMVYWVETAGFEVKEVPITFHDRQFGKSKLSKLEIVKFFINIFKLKYSTMRFLDKKKIATSHMLLY